MEEKLQVAELLDDMGVDVIEAGFPIASNGDFESVQEVARVVKNAVVCGLARAGEKDIDRAGEALRDAKQGRIHTFISTSPVHMKHKLQMEPEDVLDAVISSVTRARNWTDNVEWSPEDARVRSMTICVRVSKPRSRRVPQRSIFQTQLATPCRKNMAR